MSRILEAAEKEFLKKTSTAVAAAVEEAAKEIKKDFKKKVFDQAVSDYYEDFKPKRYKRIKKPGGLYRAFAVNTSTRNGKQIELSYDWDFNRLPQYKSNSKYHKSGNEWTSRHDEDFNWDGGNNGMPEKGWIFTNFMEGIHPKYFVDKELGVVLNKSEEFEPSYLRIKHYKDEYINGGDARDILIKCLKKQCKKL